MRNSFILVLFVSILISLVFIQCEDTTVHYTLNRQEKKLVDSLFKSQLKELQLEADSICKVEKNKLYQTVKDSLIEIRLSEIEEILPQ
jgi:hypothetical protein